MKYHAKTIAEENEEKYFSHGLAICEPRIINDSIYCKFRREEFEFPSIEVWPLVRRDGAGRLIPLGGHMTIKVSKLRGLRKLSKEKEHA